MISNRRTLPVIIALASTLLALGAFASIAAASTSFAQRSIRPASAAQTSLAPTGSAPVKTLPAPVAAAPMPMADQVDSLASAPAQAAGYAGDTIDPDGTVTVYVTSAGYAEMSAALATLGPQASYKLVTVANSEAKLESITMQIAGDRALLARHGVQLTTWGPDAASNTMQASMLDYTAAKAAWLQNEFGGSGVVSVTPATSADVLQRVPVNDTADNEAAAAAAGPNRYYDSSPFFGGDRVFIDNNENEKCTDAFTLIGNRSGASYNTTAGHCGGSSVYTNFDTRVKLGPISTRYFSDGGYDFETFPCGSCSPYVWYEGPSVGRGQGSSHVVVGTCDCNSGKVAIDGAGTGQVIDSTVTKADFCDTFSDGTETCHLNRATNSADICYPGDSGGPVYLQGPNNDGQVYATGTIVGSTTDYHTCDYQRISNLTAESDTHVATG
jgi:hypothetical protein